jgi:hypothetical protein
MLFVPSSALNLLLVRSAAALPKLIWKLAERNLLT